MTSGFNPALTAMPGGPVIAPFPVYFVRHGQTDWNAARRFQGHEDIPLNKTGRAQAAHNGDKLRAHLQGLRADIARYDLAASPLSRAQETMALLCARLGIINPAIRTDNRLIEIDLGDWNGKTPDEIDREDPGAFQRREADKWAYRVPNGESYADAAQRTRAFVQSLPGPTLIVGHGASGRLLRAYLAGHDRAATPHLTARQDVVYKLSDGRETIL